MQRDGVGPPRRVRWQPAGGRLDARRPTRVRLLLVNGLITSGLWLAAWRYVIDGRGATRVTVVFGLLSGLLLASSQIALYRQAGNWADQLYDNIDRLNRTQDELRSFLDDLPEALVVLGRDGSIREVNANTEELTGRSRDQLLGIYFSDLFGEVDRPRLLALWRAMRDNSVPQIATLTFVRADGTEALLEGEANLPVRDPDRVVIVLRDVTQRAAEARRLERARERFRMAFHGAPTGMALSTVPGGVLVDVNESLARMLGRTSEDLIGRTVEEISHPDDWQVPSGRSRAQVRRREDAGMADGEDIPLIDHRPSGNVPNLRERAGAAGARQRLIPQIIAIGRAQRDELA